MSERLVANPEDLRRAVGLVEIPAGPGFTKLVQIGGAGGTQPRFERHPVIAWRIGLDSVEPITLNGMLGGYDVVVCPNGRVFDCGGDAGQIDGFKGHDFDLDRGTFTRRKEPNTDNTPSPALTVARLRQLLAHYDENALVHLVGEGPLLQITEASNVIEPAAGERPAILDDQGPAIVTLRAVRL